MKVKLHIPDGATEEEIRRIEARHCLAAIAEGICPRCTNRLESVPGDSRSHPTGRPWLRCNECPCYWQADHTKSEWTWEASWSWHRHDPFPGGRLGV